MKRSLFILAIIGACIVLGGGFLAPETVLGDPDAKKPAPNLSGTMCLDYDLAASWPAEPVWVGMITIDGYGVYEMKFYHLTPFKEYSQASPFEETFQILSGGTVVMEGADVGVTVLANKPPAPCTYRMNGTVTNASGVFATWIGRHVHMSGIITWQIINGPDGPIVAPATAPGTFRVN